MSKLSRPLLCIVVPLLRMLCPWLAFSIACLPRSGGNASKDASVHVIIADCRLQTLRWSDVVCISREPYSVCTPSLATSAPCMVLSSSIKVGTFLDHGDMDK